MKRGFAGMLALLAVLLTNPLQAQSVTTHGFGDGDADPIRTRYLLIGPQGGAVTDEDFRGRFQLITFGYTACPDVCPTTLVELAEVLRLLGDDATGLQGIFITVDPARDTPQALATYTAFFDARILGLGGTPELIQRVTANFKVRYAKVPSATGDADFYAVDHSAGLYLLGPDGTFIKKYGYGTPAEQIAGEIHELLARG